MNKHIVALVIAAGQLFATAVHSQGYEQWDHPTKSFDAAAPRVHSEEIIIRWRVADNVSAACDQASKDFGNEGFGNQQMQGCAFWWGPTCVIITKKKPTMHTVGHEIRHCFYGAWHK